MTGGGASTLHHMCVDRCELADDRIHVKQCILYPSQDLTFFCHMRRVFPYCARWLLYSISDAGMCNLHSNMIFNLLWVVHTPLCP